MPFSPRQEKMWNGTPTIDVGLLLRSVILTGPDFVAKKYEVCMLSLAVDNLFG